MQDEEVEDLLLRLTFVPVETITEVMAEHHRAPQKRRAQTLLASTVVEMVHGEGALRAVQGSTDAFFSAELDRVFAMSETQFTDHFAHTKKVHIEVTSRAAGGDPSRVMTYSSLIVQSGLRKTRGDAKRVIKQSGLYVNGRCVDCDGEVDASRDLLHGKYLVMKVGKKNYALLAFP